MIRFLLLFVINFLIENWKKNLLIILSILLISLSYHLFKTDREPSYINIESIFNDNGKWTYVTFNGRSYHFNGEQTTYNDRLNPNYTYIKISEPGGLFIVFTVFGVISSITSIVISFMEDWDAGYITRSLVNKCMKCDEVNGLFNYYSFGKLLDTKDHIQNFDNYYRYIGFIEFIKLPLFSKRGSKKVPNETTTNFLNGNNITGVDIQYDVPEVPLVPDEPVPNLRPKSLPFSSYQASGWNIWNKWD